MNLYAKTVAVMRGSTKLIMDSGELDIIRTHLCIQDDFFRRTNMFDIEELWIKYGNSIIDEFYEDENNLLEVSPETIKGLMKWINEEYKNKIGEWK